MRITGAFLVNFSHLKRHTISFGLLDPLGQYGEEGVMIFFVISGAVIAYVAATPPGNARWRLIRSLAWRGCGRL